MHFGRTSITLRLPAQSRTGLDHHSGPFLFDPNPTTNQTPHAYTSQHEDYRTCFCYGLGAWMRLPRRNHRRNGVILPSYRGSSSIRRTRQSTPRLQFRRLLGRFRNDSENDIHAGPEHDETIFLFMPANRNRRDHTNPTNPNLSYLRAGPSRKIPRRLFQCRFNGAKQSVPLPKQINDTFILITCLSFLSEC